MEAIQSKWNSILFELRKRITGRLRLRLGLPRIEDLQTSAHLECQFYLLALSRAWPESRRREVTHVWDIGCRNWSYASAIAASFPRARQLTGVEVDGGRRYWNLFRRMDLALAHARSLSRLGREARCLFDDFRKLEIPAQEGLQAFCFFFPFVSTDPCLGWGLPREFANFDELLQPLLKVRPVLLMSAHQGGWEAELADQVYRSVGWKADHATLTASEVAGIWPAPYDVHLFTVDLSRNSG